MLDEPPLIVRTQGNADFIGRRCAMTSPSRGPNSFHAAHLFHHRAHGHRILARLHVLHHVAHHVLLHLHHAIPHRPALGHHFSDDGGGRSHLLHARRGVHRGDEIIEPLIGGLHVGHHFLVLGHHGLAFGLHAGGGAPLFGPPRAGRVGGMWRPCRRAASSCRAPRAGAHGTSARRARGLPKSRPPNNLPSSPSRLSSH